MNRKTMRGAMIAILALMAAACGGSGTPSNRQSVNRTAPQASGARIAALPEAQRNATFYRAIHDAGLDCQQVTGSAPAEPYHDMPVWTATCRGGGHWTLVVGADEIVQILNANEAQLVRGPRGNGQ
jgi:hypothetical protein